MPVKKIRATGAKKKRVAKKQPDVKVEEPLVMEPPKAQHTHTPMFDDFMRKILATLFAVFMVYLIVFLGTHIRNNIQSFYFIGQADKQERVITIDAEGRVKVEPNVAEVTMGVASEAKTVAEAQQRNTETMNKLIASLKTIGISSEDLQTANYNVYPRYRYTEEEGQIVDGHQVSQNVDIIIRDLDKAQTVLALAGELGITNVGGLNFKVEDKGAFLEQAREDALAEIEMKARALSESLGVDFTRIAAYNEYEAGDAGDLPFRALSFDGFGGEAAPDVQTGTDEVVLHVSVTFEMR